MDLRERLLEQIRGFDAVVDAHEHLAPERERVKLEPDVCFLFSHYLTGSLAAAGFTVEGRRLDRAGVREFLLDTSKPVEERFGALEPYIPAVRYTSYAEAMWRTLRDIYGFQDITRDNFMDITEAMRGANTHGIYERIIRDKCRIRFSLTQAGRTDYEKPFMVPVLNFVLLIEFPEGRRTVEERAGKLGMEVHTLDDYMDYCRAQLRKWRDEERVVGMKTVSQPYEEPVSGPEARGLFAKLMSHGRLEEGNYHLLSVYLREKVLAMCGEEDLTVAVHAGVWDDFRRLDPRHNIPLVQKYPEVRFDIYHMGIPYVRDLAIMAGNWHNVYVNWCWTHIVSYYMTQSGIPEYLDFVPVDKIIAFGGDYLMHAVEKVYGHLSMAQENVATALARLVLDGRMTEDEAVDVAKMWFWDNPVKIYKLDRSS